MQAPSIGACQKGVYYEKENQKSCDMDMQPSLHPPAPGYVHSPHICRHDSGTGFPPQSLPHT